MKMQTIQPAKFSAVRLLRLRKALDITQEIMAANIGIRGKQATIAKWETGANPIASWAAREFIIAETMVAVQKARKKKSAKKR